MQKDLSSALNAMRIEELAKAAIAESNYNNHIEERLTDLHALEGENLELGCVSYSHRGL